MQIRGNRSIEELIPGEKYSLRISLGEKVPSTNRYKRAPRKIVYCTKREAKYELALYKKELLEEAETLNNPDVYIKMPTIEEYCQEYLEIRKEAKTLYRRAVREGIIEYSKNPCFGIELDKPEPPDRHSLTREEYATSKYSRQLPS